MSKSKATATEHRASKPRQGDAEVDGVAAQLAAVSEVMQVLGQSRDDDGPVFQTILTNAVALCNAQMAGLILATPQDEFQTLAAHIGMEPMALELFETGGMKMDPDLSYAARSIVEARLIAFEDMGESDLYAAGSPVVQSMVDDSSIRSVLFVPLVGQHGAIGAITLFRNRRAPFSADEIALVQAFALQAVIAIENQRQFQAVQKQVEREAATREVLSVISRSRDDEQPVFEKIVELGHRLLGASFSALVLGREGDAYQRLAASENVPDYITQMFHDQRFPMDPAQSITPKAIIGKEVIHIHDMAETEEYKRRDPRFVPMVEDAGMRTNLFIPLIHNGVGIGCLLHPRDVVKPYTDDEIALIQTFADQAVIAIENARLFTETQEALAQQTATAEALKTISQAAFDLPTVLQTLLEAAARLCDGTICILFHRVGDELRLGANFGCPPEMVDYHLANPHKLDRRSVAGRAVLDRATIHIPDIAEDAEFDNPQSTELGGWRSIIAVPMFRDGEVIGVFDLARPTPGPFSRRQIELVETFADQAVIAINNTQLFDEVKARTTEVEEALERQKVTSEILHAISQSVKDTQPVFDLVVQKAAELCGASFCVLDRFDGEAYHFCAQYGFPPDLAAELMADYPFTEGKGHMSAMVVQTGQVVQIEDAQSGDVYYAPELAKAVGWRRMLGVPIRVGTQIWGRSLWPGPIPLRHRRQISN